MYSSEQIQEAVIRAKVPEYGHTVFRSGRHSDVKLEMDRLRDDIRMLKVVMGGVAYGFQELGTDLVVPVPSGPNRLLRSTKEKLPFQIPRIANTTKRVNGDFYIDGIHRVRQAEQITIFEDAITTAGALCAMAEKVRSFNPDAVMTLLGIWKRGTDDEVDYQGLFKDVVMLVDEPIPSWLPEECPHPVCHAA